MQRIRQRNRLSPGTLIALLALAMSLGGIAYAAVGPNSVRSVNIAPRAVKTTDLGGNAVTWAKLAPNAVRTRKLADGAVTEAKVAPAAIATSGLADGAVNGAKLALVTGSATEPLPDDGSVHYALAYCNLGQKVIGGGFSFDPINVADLTLLGSFAGHHCPGSRGDCWIVSAANPAGGTGDASVTATAMCV